MMFSTGRPTIEESGNPTKILTSAEHEVLTADHFLVAHEV